MSPGPQFAPRWIGGVDAPRRVALLVGTCVTALTAVPSTRFLPALLCHGDFLSTPPVSSSSTLVLIAWLMPSTTLVGYLVLRAALRSPNPAQATSTCVTTGMFAGAINAGLLLATRWFENSFLHPPTEQVGAWTAAALFGVTFLVGASFGGVFGIPLGLLYGVAYAPLVRWAVSERTHISHETPDRALRVGACWAAVVVVAVFATTADQVGCAPFFPYLELPAVSFVGVALAGAWWACKRMRARDRWLHRVRTGQEPHYRVVERDVGVNDLDADGRELLPWAHERRGEPDGVLERELPPEGSPYRGQHGWEGVALVLRHRCRRSARQPILLE